MIPWLRRNFLARRTLDRVVLDAPDALLRRFTGRSDWPPYSLRSYVGGSADFAKVGEWFRRDLSDLGLLRSGTRVLDMGCGCGRIARALATDAGLRELNVSYAGMDIDHDSIAWCQRNITPLNPRFRFYSVDARNPSYNPRGSVDAAGYRFPHAAESFDLILATSLFTHMLPDELGQYLTEASRLLSPGGVLYASLFLYNSIAEVSPGTSRFAMSFPVARDGYAINREDFPTNAVAYQETFFQRMSEDRGLERWGGIERGTQDIALLTKRPPEGQKAQLTTGWHELEEGQWRWTEREFTVVMPGRAMQERTTGATSLRLNFTIPAGLAGLPLTVSARVCGSQLPARVYRSAGMHSYCESIRQQAFAGETLEIEFQVQPSASAQTTAAGDLRELGVQVLFAASCRQGDRDLFPITLLPSDEKAAV